LARKMSPENQAINRANQEPLNRFIK
jgi:hypothetical protein